MILADIDLKADITFPYFVLQQLQKNARICVTEENGKCARGQNLNLSAFLTAARLGVRRADWSVTLRSDWCISIRI